MGTKAQLKIKQTNRKWRHEQKRRQKTRAERVRKAQAIERRGRAKNLKRQQTADYVGGLQAELLS